MLEDADRDRDFPSLKNRAYLNTAAEGIPPVSSGDALLSCHEHKSEGMDGREKLFSEYAACQAEAAALLGLRTEEIAFCSSTSEAYNLLATAIDFGDEGQAVISDLDFPSGATPWLQLSPRPAVELWRNREGVLELSDLEPLLRDETRLVQVSLVSFLTGYRIEWKPFRDLVRKKAPHAILAVDVTQAAGRVVLDCLDADCLFASGYKWLLGSHGSCLVAVPGHATDRIVVRAGGWYHLANAFEPDRFSHAEPYPGARGFSVGMPSFPGIYTLKAGISCVRRTGVDRIARHADTLVERLHAGLAEIGIRTMSPWQPGNASGIVSFRSDKDVAIHASLREAGVHVMHQAGRLRISVHGYNRVEDIERCLRIVAANSPS